MLFTKLQAFLIQSILIFQDRYVRHSVLQLGYVELEHVFVNVKQIAIGEFTRRLAFWLSVGGNLAVKGMVSRNVDLCEAVRIMSIQSRDSQCTRVLYTKYLQRQRQK
jgi:hypothetical protein